MVWHRWTKVVLAGVEGVPRVVVGGWRPISMHGTSPAPTPLTQLHMPGAYKTCHYISPNTFPCYCSMKSLLSAKLGISFVFLQTTCSISRHKIADRKMTKLHKPAVLHIYHVTTFTSSTFPHYCWISSLVSAKLSHILCKKNLCKKKILCKKAYLVQKNISCAKKHI